MKITVEDNGIGMKKSGEYVSKNDNHLNMGVAVTRKRLEIIGKKMNVETSIDFSEISPDSPNTGTRVILIVPYTYSESEFK